MLSFSYIHTYNIPYIQMLYVHTMYRVFIKYCVFFLKNVVIFLNSASSAEALNLPISGPSMKSDVHTEEKKRERPESGIYFNIFEKNTILMNTLYIYIRYYQIIKHYNS